MGVRVLPARHDGRLTGWQAILRTIGLALAIIPCFLGFLPALFDSRRRALLPTISPARCALRRPVSDGRSRFRGLRLKVAGSELRAHLDRLDRAGRARLQVEPEREQATPSANRTCDPSSRIPIRPSTYGGVQTSAPSAPPMPAAAILSRRDPVGLIPTSRAGTLTYVSIITPTTIPSERPNQGGPSGERRPPRTPARHRRSARPRGRPGDAVARARTPGRIRGLPGCEIANANTALR